MHLIFHLRAQPFMNECAFSDLKQHKGLEMFLSFKKKKKCQRWKISYCCVFWAKSTLFIIWIITRPNVNMFIWWNIIHGAKMLFLLFCLSTGPVSRQHTSTSMTVLRQEWSLHLTWQHRVTHTFLFLYKHSLFLVTPWICQMCFL